MSQPVIEPNFEGEEMKIPEGVVPMETPVKPAKTFLSATIIVLLSLALIAIFAGLGYWYYLVTSTPIIDGTDSEMDTLSDDSLTNYQADEQSTVGTSDEIEDIEADIENTDLDNLDIELAEIDAELEAAMSAQ